MLYYSCYVFQISWLFDTLWTRPKIALFLRFISKFLIGLLKYKSQITLIYGPWLRVFIYSSIFPPKKSTSSIREKILIDLDFYSKFFMSSEYTSLLHKIT